MMRQFETVLPSQTTLDGTNVNWTSVPGATGYDVVRGALGGLLASRGDFSAPGVDLTCLVNGLLVTSTPHAGSPAPGEGFFYLTRSRDPIGAGTYDTGISSQVGRRDAEIGAAPGTCM